MRDIPMFPTEYGIAGLVLNQIPYTGDAYVHIHGVTDLRGLLEECVGFCTAAGADRVFACGDCDLSEYPLYTQVVKMQRPLEGIGETDACTMPVTEQTLERWLQLHNDAMTHVDNGAYLSVLDGKKLLLEGGGYFIHRDGQLLGIGIAKDDQLPALASTIKGAGKDVVLALCRALAAETVHLEVASTNHRAIRLYERLGFLQTGVKCSWYRVK